VSEYEEKYMQMLEHAVRVYTKSYLKNKDKENREE